MIKSLALSLALLLAGTLSALASSTGGTPNSISAPGACLTASAGAGSSPVVTLGLNQVNQYKISGSSYTANTADACLITGVGNASAFTLTVPQAGTTGFGASWGAGYTNVGTANVTVNTTTSLFEGGGGGTSLTLLPGATVWLSSDGTNWLTQLSGDTPLSYSVQYIAGQNPNNAVLVAHLPQPILITSMIGRPAAATGATATASLFAAPSGTACASGTALTDTTHFNANGTAATDQVLAGTTTQIPAGDSLCLQTTGTWTSGAGAITVYAVPGPTPGTGVSPANFVSSGLISGGCTTACTQAITSTTASQAVTVAVSIFNATAGSPGTFTVTLTPHSDACSLLTSSATGTVQTQNIYGCTATAGDTSVSVTQTSGGGPFQTFFTEIAWANAAASSPFEVAASNYAASSTTMTCTTSGNTTVSNDAIYAVALDSVGGSGYTNSSGYSNVLSDSSGYSGFWIGNRASGASYSATIAGTGSSGNMACNIVAIKP